MSLNLAASLREALQGARAIGNARGVLNGLVKLYAGIKKFFKAIIDSYMAGYNSIPHPTAARMKRSG